MGRKRGKYSKKNRRKGGVEEPEVKAKKINYSAKKEIQKIKDEIRPTVILWLFGSKYFEGEEIDDIPNRDIMMLTDFTANVILNTKRNVRKKERKERKERREKKEGKK